MSYDDTCMRLAAAAVRLTAAVVLLASAAAICAAAAGDSPAAPAVAEHPKDNLKGDAMTIYVGTYTGPKSKGIYMLHMDPATGALTEPEVAAETQNPSFLAVDPKRRFLYAVNETDRFAGKPTGSVTALSIGDGGRLKVLNQQPSGGTAPCHLVVDAAGRNVLLANYNSGSVEVLPISKDGSLAAPSDVIQHAGTGPNRQRQAGPHAHFVDFDPSGKLVLACDLGIDKIMIYKYDSAAGKLSPSQPPWATATPGAGPRHFVFAPGGRFVYVINEIDSSMEAFSWDAAAGAMKQFQHISTLPADFRGNSTTAEIAIHPSGKFLYGSNRGHDSIAIFAVDAATGKLTPAGHELTGGKTPRSFAIDPAGNFLIAANQDPGNLVVFRIDQATGKLKATGAKVDVPAPVCVIFVPPAK